MSNKRITDAESIINVAKGVWPDYQITVQNLMHPNCDLLLDFFDRFMSKIEIDCSAEIRKVENSLHEAEPHLILAIVYLRVIKFLIGNVQNPFMEQINIGIILCPTPKHTNFIFRFLLNFLSYWKQLEKQLDDIVMECETRSIQQEKMKHLEQNLLTSQNNLAIKRSKAQSYKIELEKKNLNLKDALKEIDEKKAFHDNSRVNLEKKLKSILKELEPKKEEKAELDREYQFAKEYINVGRENEKLEGDINSLGEKNESLTQTLKVKKTNEIDLNNKIENKLFYETNDRLIDGYKEGEDLDLKLKKLKQKLNSMIETEEDTSSQIKSMKVDIKKLIEKASILEEKWQNKKVLSEQKLDKLKNEISSLELQISEIENDYSTNKNKLDALLKEKNKLQDATMKFDKCCENNYKKVLTGIKSTHTSMLQFSAVAKNTSDSNSS